MTWIDVKERLPEPFEEVCVWVNGKRGANWRDNHHLVAYMSLTGKFWEERHPSDDPLPVVAWQPLPPPYET